MPVDSRAFCCGVWPIAGADASNSTAEAAITKEALISFSIPWIQDEKGVVPSDRSNR
jgi:hypothetical protein